MALQLGLVGLPNVGKSTLFNALTKAGAAVANYPFTTIEPNIGVAPVADQRLDRIAEIIAPDRIVPATMRVVDIAGLVKGASQGEGLGNQFLAHIREVDAIALVVRCFHDENVPHVTPELDPIGDVDVIITELALADLAVLERYLERLLSTAKGNPRRYASAIAACERGLSILSTGERLGNADLSPEEHHHLSEAALITTKPLLLVANISEIDLPEGGELAARVKSRAQALGAECIVLCAAFENALLDFDSDEAALLLADYGLQSTGLERFIWSGYRLLELNTFFTTTGGHEVRAWTLPAGRTVLEAAGQIHNDMARGFIRAEVVSFSDLDRAGSLAHAREKGLLRLEGRDYIVHDGDIIHIRFNV